MRTADIRRRFLDFFAARDHQVVPSASLVYQDPTLLFVNAGMVPFKPYFTGAEMPPFSRATSVQKCVRTLDIEEVGKTTRHGTFFQMNGNFSFGDYFKEGAIAHAWELITSSTDQGGFGFHPDTVWVTVLDGDDEAISLWRSVGMPDERIQRRGLLDNYWHMGVPGPGGPCSEIYIDRGPEYGPDGGPIVDEDRFLEIWNLVFMQSELSAVRAKDDFDVRAELPRKNIDTGMGLERVAYLLQGKQNMYEIDEVYPVIARAAELAGKTYGAKPEDDVRLRVVGDHVRSSLMLMADGVTPGNEARGYVLRRLLRRSVRAMRLLGVREEVMPELLPISRDLMGTSWPEVTEGWERIAAVAYAEEDAFRRTLTSGTQLFDLATSRAKQAGRTGLSGEEAFTLHDTHGFPIDLTLEMAAEQGLSVDRDAFVELMAEQKARAKADARAKKGGAVDTEAYRELRSHGETVFTGYQELDLDTTVIGVLREGQVVPVATVGDTVEVVLAQTPFYAEAGGQDADRGEIIDHHGLRVEITDVQSPVAGLIVHTGIVRSGELHRDAAVVARVDGTYRTGASMAHSATHLVHAALREIVGPTATQAGSYNRPGYLRFDFSATSGLTKSMREEIEGRANDQIIADHEVLTKTMSLGQAKSLGAMAMFGEKYGDEVRVVEMDGAWSRELCGGTHVAHSSQIGLLSLTTEASIGSGVRRVEALVGTEAFRQLAAERSLVATLADTLKVQPEQLPERVDKLVSQLKNAEKQIAELRSAQLLAGAADIANSATEVAGISYVSQQVPEVTGGDLRTLVNDVRDRLGARPGVVALIGGTPTKPSLVVATTAAARELGLEAGRLLGPGAQALGGKGGGKADIAQGGGTDASQAEPALRAIAEAITAARA